MECGKLRWICYNVKELNIRRLRKCKGALVVWWITAIDYDGWCWDEIRNNSDPFRSIRCIVTATGCPVHNCINRMDTAVAKYDGAVYLIFSWTDRAARTLWTCVCKIKQFKRNTTIDWFYLVDWLFRPNLFLKCLHNVNKLQNSIIKNSLNS